MLYEAVGRLVSFDFSWFVELALGNFFWIFAFACIAFFFFGGKKTFFYTIFLIVWIWAFGDFDIATGLVWTSASFLLIYYTTKVAVLVWVQNSPKLKNYVVAVNEVHFFTLLLISNFFLR